jgi:hypothetical protein
VLAELCGLVSMEIVKTQITRKRRNKEQGWGGGGRREEEGEEEEEAVEAGVITLGHIEKYKTAVGGYLGVEPSPLLVTLHKLLEKIKNSVTGGGHGGSKKRAADGEGCTDERFNKEKLKEMLDAVNNLDPLSFKLTYTGNHG